MLVHLALKDLMKKYRKNEAPSAEDDKALVEQVGAMFPPKKK